MSDSNICHDGLIPEALLLPDRYNQRTHHGRQQHFHLPEDYRMLHGYNNNADPEELG